MQSKRFYTCILHKSVALCNIEVIVSLSLLFRVLKYVSTINFETICISISLRCVKGDQISGPDGKIHHGEPFLEVFIETTNEIKKYKLVAKILKIKI